VISEAFDLFIVPIGYHEAGGVEYEAVFGNSP